jgi:hypothetical protein
MRRRFLLLVVCLAALGVAAAPVAANSKPTTGDRISLFSAPATFTAGAPFYIEHGFSCDTTIGDKVSDCMHASTHFDLFLDGVSQRSTVDIDNAPTLYLKRNLTNYPAGLPAGTHTFVGVFVFNGTTLLTLTATITFN